jgi:hypothetical protein
MGPSVVVAYLSLVGALVAALTAAAGKYFYDLRIARRKDRLERVNAQLRRLYGPLLALDLAALEAWTSFRRTWRPDRPYWDGTPLPSEAEAEAWRIWMTSVFMPLNERMEHTIVENADLLVEPEIPRPLLTFCAHVAAYKAIRTRWEKGDFTEHAAPVEYPEAALREYVQRHFAALKNEQTLLLGEVQGAPRRRSR